MHRLQFALGTLLALFVGLAGTAQAQGTAQLPPRLNLTGTFTTGFYHAGTQNGRSVSQNSLLGSARFRLSGYVHHPRFLTFDVKPQVSLGRQSNETFFPDGRGVSATVTFLSGNTFPLTISYTRLGRQITTFGALDRLAGLQADTSQSALDVNWRIRFRRMPQISLNYSRYTDRYDPLEAFTPQVRNRARAFSVQLDDRRWGWLFNSRFRADNSDSNLLNVFNPGQAPYRFSRRTRELQGNASRQVTHWLSVNLYAGRNSSKSELASRPFDQSFNYVHSNAGFRRGEKLTGSARAGITTNLVGFRLEQALGSPGSGPPGSGSPLLVAGKGRLTLVTFSGQMQYAITKDLRVNGQATRDSTRAPTAGVVVSPDSSLTSGQGGVTYSHAFRRWQFQSSYSGNVGRLHYNGANPSRSIGHSGHGSASFETLRGTEITASAQGSWQRTKDGFQLENREWGMGLSASRPFVAGWRICGAYNFEKTFFDTTNIRFHSSDHGLSITATHRRVDMTLGRQLRDGLTFQPAFGVGSISPIQAQALVAAMPSLLLIPSSSSSSTAAISVRLVRNLSGRFLWSRNRQIFSGGLSNHFTQWEAGGSYRFRRLTFDFGYIRHEQNFGVGSFLRDRFYFRVVRDFRVF